MVDVRSSSEEERDGHDADHAAGVGDGPQLLVALAARVVEHTLRRGVRGDDRRLRHLAGVQRGLPADVPGVDDDAELVHGLDAGHAEVGQPGVRALRAADPDRRHVVVRELAHPQAQVVRVGQRVETRATDRA